MELCAPHIKKRIVWIDYCRALTVSLIVLEHVQYIHHVYEAISACAMPTFIFLSGCTFERSAKAPFLELLRKKFRTLIIPYIGFSAILFAFWFLALRNFGITYRSEATVADVLLQILCGTNSTFFVTPLWSLTCLFVVEILFWCLFRIRNKYLMATIIALLFIPGLLCRTHSGILPVPHIFWNFDQACYLLLFFAIGFVSSKKNLVEKIFCSVKHNLLIILVSITAYTIALIVREKTTLPLIFLSMHTMAAFSGLITNVAICRSIRKNAVLSFIGQNTMTIFALHIMVQGILRGSIFRVSPAALEWIKSSLWGSIVLMVVSIAALVPVILFINRFTPWLAGKKAKTF